MDLNRLKIFLEVVRHKSFSRAAESLFLSQPTVSSHIKNLEEIVGAPLLERRYPRLVLTKEGHTFLKYAREMVALGEEAMEAVRGQYNSEQAHLTLAASSVPGAFLLPGLLHDFLALYPRVTFAVAERDSDQVLEEVFLYNFDMGLVGKEINEPKLQFCQLAEDELVLVAAPGLIKKKNILSDYQPLPAVPLSLLPEIPLLLREPGSATRSVFEKGLAAQNMTLKDLNIRGYWESPQALINSVFAGLGATVLSRRTIEKPLKMGLLECYLLEKIDLKRSFYLVYLKNRTFHPLARRFIEFARQQMASAAKKQEEDFYGP